MRAKESSNVSKIKELEEEIKTFRNETLQKKSRTKQKENTRTYDFESYENEKTYMCLQVDSFRFNNFEIVSQIEDINKLTKHYLTIVTNLP